MKAKTLNALLEFVLVEQKDYFEDTSIRKEYPDLLSMVQDSLQEQEDNNKLTTEKRKLLFEINKIICAKKIKKHILKLYYPK